MSLSPEAIHTNRADVQPHSGGYPSCFVDQCRQLVARRYVEVGYITEADLDRDGYLDREVDPYVDDSEYFWKADEEGRVVATLRIIHSSKVNFLSRLPIEKAFQLFPAQRRALRKARLENPAGVVEISALAKERGVDSLAAIDMYKAVWQHAKRTSLELCAISADARLHEVLIETFSSAIDVAGKPTEMMGSLTVPSLLYPDKCAEAVAGIYQQKLESGDDAEAYKNLIGYLIEGLEQHYLDDSEVAAFRSMGLAA